MQSWPRPDVPSLPGQAPPLRLFDTATGEVRPTSPGPQARLYVCGITPYDATHLGHAATYVTFDLVQRLWLDSGHDVRYAQNVTDVDDPLLERAARDGQDWRQLAAEQVQLFRDDMTALRVLPPDDYVGVVESVPVIAQDVRRLLDTGFAYRLPVPTDEQGAAGAADVYLDLAEVPRFGAVSGWTREQMLEVFAERGGDPDREGKRDVLDPLLWRGARDGEPSWDDAELGAGRPGWHMECTSIALRHLGMAFDVQGGGNDLVFPHHEMSAVQGQVLTEDWPFARLYAHQGMVGLDGEKMSKSRGNLVLVSRLRRGGADPMTVRLALLAHHYRTDWFWDDRDLSSARERLGRWRRAVELPVGPSATGTVQRVRELLADDLDSPHALAAVDRWADEQLTRGGDDPEGPRLVRRAVDALLGVEL
ncbi:MAG TPA: cysteine--1-D-myo-inosityl 2-amino-2-deoxy-alpha-D-glucopyranoside ligase [Actinomycetales bacterium]|nr:cysteine--1-D-myo-inosityl 2-amino-2-deoxy-alpha-D-glucopyranoside ligase [Actinomycetales bacterium]